MTNKISSMDKMLSAGIHFGHRTSRWHPKMKPYIFTQRNGIHIIDLSITHDLLEIALDYMARLAREDKSILFVSTKTQTKADLKELAISLKMPYVAEKWMGGTLTNFEVIKKSTRKFIDLQAKKEAGKLSKYTKKEQLDFDKEIKKLETRVGGLVLLNKLPDAIFIWDAKKEATTIKEAVMLKIPVIAVCDTNTNPTGIKYVIPANDDSTRGLKLICDRIKEALKKS
ncbi:30S ribosomal protein S2 [Patescibacteria group bacterium]|nr:30S ribosomal protein S2 [Patescibacteria group bacterium]